MLSNLKKPYFLRRFLYAVLALVLVVATGLGWITDTQSDQLLAQADQLLNLVVAVALGIAATKANPQSDEKPGRHRVKE